MSATGPLHIAIGRVEEDDDTDLDIHTTTAITPGEQLALLVAAAQVKRGEEISPNVAQTLALAVVRLEIPNQGATPT